MPTGSLTHRITHTALYCCMPCRTFAPVVILCVRLPVGIACVHGCLFSLKFWGAVTQNWCISGPMFNGRSYLTFAHRSHPHSLAKPIRYTLYSNFSFYLRRCLRQMRPQFRYPDRPTE